MNIPQYRVSGYPCAKSLAYLTDMKVRGWPACAIESLKADLPRFESASIRHGFEVALKNCVNFVDPLHYPFLQNLNEHVQITIESEISEELRRKATTNDKDSIAASTILLRLNEPQVALSQETGSNYRVKELREMTDEELDREIKNTEERLNSVSE